MAMRHLICVLLCAVWGAGCAARAPVVVLAPTVLDLGAADRLVDEGCYACLLEALGVYEQAEEAQKQFSTALLLAMREKELGLDAFAWIERARTFSTPDTTTYVEIVEALPWTTVGTATDFNVPRPSQETIQGWLAFLARPGASSVLDRYLRLAVTCSRQGSADAVSVETPDSRLILQYRLGLCGVTRRTQLDSVFAASPRFAEVGFFLARYELINSGAPQTVSRALPLLVDAHEAIPQSPVIAVTLGTVWRARNEFARALALYDDALARRPHQRDALLGRTMTLTYLGRGEEAIVAATSMIELGTWYLGDAFYWRAWNLYQRNDLAAAAADVLSAKDFQSSAELLTLSGMVAYDQQRRVDARREFQAARAKSPATNCPALWYLGLIDIDEGMSTGARDMFALASGCYSSAASMARAELESLPPDLSPEATAQQQRDLERRVADNTRQGARAALNTALLSQQLADRETAVRFAQIALGHELTRERAQSVLERTTTR
jgi:tetratricopeptide (TPR) repeat protein